MFRSLICVATPEAECHLTLVILRTEKGFLYHRVGAQICDSTENPYGDTKRMFKHSLTLRQVLHTLRALKGATAFVTVRSITNRRTGNKALSFSHFEPSLYDYKAVSTIPCNLYLINPPRTSFTVLLPSFAITCRFNSTNIPLSLTYPQEFPSWIVIFMTLTRTLSSPEAASRTSILSRRLSCTHGKSTP